ncbi:RNA exonuclease 1-like protein [Gryllus bimaculatus]|nr:RNA exonuclease 1-like protein [Gryllus bimaculatus]
MLPSTGKFKEINCPFFDSGLCERPYCHFRHVKKDSSELLQSPASAVNTVNPTLSLGDNGEILQQLVSEAVRKVLEQTDLPSALARPSGSNAVESVSRNLVTKVTEVLAPPLAASTSSQQTYNVPSPQQKVPSYKPTPISVLKNRHIPIPYSPSLTKSSTVLRKRSSSDESSIIQKKLKNQELDESGKSSVTFSSTLATKVYEPSNVSGIEPDSVLNVSDSSQYSPAPVKGWKDNGFKYTPSAIETLTQNTYVPSSSNSAELPIAEYEPSEKSESSVEPTYEPLATSGFAVDNASYEPSLVSNSEPEYQPSYCDKTTKEYVPTDISKLEGLANADLDISPEIDLLHDLLHGELIGSDSEDTEKRKNSDSEDQIKHLVSDAKTSSVEKLKNEVEKHKSEYSKKKSESDRKKSEDRKRTESDRKEDTKKESETDKRRDSSKRKSDSKKSESASSGKKRTESDRKKDDGDKKKSDNRRKSEHNENDKKRSDDKKVSAERKHSEHRKKGESDKKKGDTLGEKKKSENEVKKSESDKKKSVSGKDSSNKITSNTHNSKLSVNSEQKNSERTSSSSHSEHKHSSSKSVSEKKNHESKKHNHSHKKEGHSINSHHKHSEEKVSKTEEYSKSKTLNSKRKSDAIVLVNWKKMKSSHKVSKPENIKEPGNEFADEITHGNSVSDSEVSDADDILNNVTLPCDMWVSSSDEDEVTKECYRIFQEYEPNSVERKPKPTYKVYGRFEKDILHACRTKQSGIERVLIGMKEARKIVLRMRLESCPSVPQHDEEETPVPVKRRVAHEGAQNSKLLKPPVRRPSKPNPSQILSERFQKVRESHAQVLAQAQLQAQMQTQAQAQVSPHSQSVLGSPPSMHQRISDGKSSASQSSFSSLLSCAGRKRIAHVPNVSIMLDAKLKMQQKLKEKAESAEKGLGASTKAQTVQKGVQRVAHVPSEQVLTRPVVKGVGGKIPSNVRQTYLDLLVDEYIKISSSNQEAYEKAEEEEKAIYSRSTTRAVYTSHVSNTINRLRKAAHNNSASTSSKGDGKIVNRTVSHTSMLAGKVGTKGSWSIEKPRKPPASVVNKSLYESLSQFIMAEEQLKQNGFPMSHDEEKGVAVIHNFYKKPFVPKTPSQRMCARCSKIYYVNQQGRAVKEELCVYHWGRLFQSKTRGGWEARYNCCQGHGDAIGCSVGNCHVSDNFDPNNLRGFVKTLPKEKAPPDGDYGVYALDCEMCYTTVGLELTRVTVIGSDLSVVYESLVKPESTILDYNTRFSGIKEEDLENVTTNIYEVQSVLLSFINDKTILVGHSLESDFKALKVFIDFFTE